MTLDKSAASSKSRQPIMGIGAIPSRIPSKYDLGHMWLYWNDKAAQLSLEYRGYYPLVNRIPAEFQPLERWREFFFKNSSPGARFRDLKASSMVRFRGHYCKDKNWKLSSARQYRLKLRCWIPPGVDSIQEGQYSFDTTRFGCNNCASWAIRVANRIMESKNFLPLPQPARIKKVINIIWEELNENDKK